MKRLVGSDAPVLYLLRIAALAAVYYGAAKLGLTLALANRSVTAVWPPAGIALAALLLWGYRYWPGVALGALFANGWTGVPIDSTNGRALPMWTRWYTVGPQKYMPIGPGGGASVSTPRVYE